MTQPTNMKAVICTTYGAPEVLQLTTLKKPVPKDNEVLVKIHATAVNSGDVRVRGLAVDGFMKIIMRFVLGFKGSRKPVLGTIYSGVVEAVGKQVRQFQPGDEVFGSRGFKFGTYAEYITVAEDSPIDHKPSNATFEEAAAILFGGMTSAFFLHKAGIKAGQRVLIYGATGSVGAAGVEIARSHGAVVTAVCSEQGVELARQLGSDAIVVYTSEAYKQLNDPFDMVYDAVGKTTKKTFAALLKPNGIYLTVGGLSMAKERKKEITFLKQLFEAGKLHAHIDKSYLLTEIVEAHRYVDTGRKKGNVVVKIIADNA